MFSVKGCILSFLAGAFFFFLLLSSVWWVLTGIAFWLVFFCMENRRRVPSQTIRKFTPDNSKERGAADDTYNIWR